MSDPRISNLYYGYAVKQNPRTERWEIYWKDKPIEEDFATQAEA